MSPYPKKKLIKYDNNKYENQHQNQHENQHENQHDVQKRLLILEQRMNNIEHVTNDNSQQIQKLSIGLEQASVMYHSFNEKLINMSHSMSKRNMMINFLLIVIIAIMIIYYMFFTL